MTSQNEGDDVRGKVPTSWGEERRGWHIDKTISVSDLISIAMILIPALIWASTVETRFTSASAQAAALERQVAADKIIRDQQRNEDRQTTQATLNDLQQQLRTLDARISDKLDKISEKVGARK